MTYQNLANEVEPGCHILVDDGLVDLLVKEVRGPEIHCEVENGGVLSNNKSINIPNVHIHLPALTEKDREDLRFAAEQDFDYVAASFVRKAEDVEDIREELCRHGGQGIRIISKIENLEGVDNLNEIIEASDGLMVARGDLGVEVPACQVPVLQKEMIAKCIHQGKPVITATQMLDSMMRNPRPTRAEVSDVANAVFDGPPASCSLGRPRRANIPWRLCAPWRTLCWRRSRPSTTGAGSRRWGSPSGRNAPSAMPSATAAAPRHWIWRRRPS